MKQLRDVLESVFDKDLVEKDPIDWSWFKIKNPQKRSTLFLEIEALLNTPEIDKLLSWVFDDYMEHQVGFDYIVKSLVDAFNKNHACTWFTINQNDFEEMGEEMTEEEIDHYNYELDQYFSHAYQTELCSCFVMDKGKIPDVFMKLFKETGWWKPSMSNVKEWAIEYYNNYDQVLTFYGCPKGLDPVVKKILYD